MSFFADNASFETCPVIENIAIAKDTRRIRVHAPAMAEKVVPGQFFMLRNPAGNDPLIGRAFALYDKASDGSGWIDLVYLVKGKLTQSLAKLDSDSHVALWGPLGNGFAPRPVDHLIMVAGGIGQTPFLTLAREANGLQKFGSPERQSAYASEVSFCYGARSKDYLAGVSQFEEAGCDVVIATDDGSHGPARRVTDALTEVIDRIETQAASSNLTQSARIVCCGPEPMMEAVSHLAAQRKMPCEVSLETPMACGIGICFSCVAKVGRPDDWDYKRTCVEGPVFNSEDIVWE